MKLEQCKLSEIEPDFWMIDDQGVKCFLFLGEEYALLIDTGFGVKDLKGIIKKITDLPIKLINTHADMDHIHCNLQFGAAFMHPAEIPHYLEQVGNQAVVEPLQDHEVISLGKRKFEVLLMPGHTPGSIMLLDRENRILLSGDSVQDGDIFMFGPGRDMPQYIRSMELLVSMADQFDRIYPSHGGYPLTPDIIPELLDGAKKVFKEEAEWFPGAFHDIPIRVFDIGVARFLRDAIE